jgi:2-phosphosulfolactate phosphatase
MVRSLEVLFTPADVAALKDRDLRGTTCVVFDVLRATSTMVTALAAGAEAIIPVVEIDEAVAWRRRRPDVLLAGERDGVRILAPQSGGVDFDLGNSPREFTPERVRGRTIVMTTTNGTRALRACAGANAVLIGAFANLGAVIRWIERVRPASLLAVCSGTHEQAALEDALAAGALCDRIWPCYAAGQIADSTVMARRLFREAGGDLLSAVSLARNARRLLAHADLRDDVEVCLRHDVFQLVAAMDRQGAIRKLPGEAAC